MATTAQAQYTFYLNHSNHEIFGSCATTDLPRFFVTELVTGFTATVSAGFPGDDLLLLPWPLPGGSGNGSYNNSVTYTVACKAANDNYGTLSPPLTIAAGPLGACCKDADVDGVRSCDDVVPVVCGAVGPGNVTAVETWHAGLSCLNRTVFSAELAGALPVMGSEANAESLFLPTCSGADILGFVATGPSSPVCLDRTTPALEVLLCYGSNLATSVRFAAANVTVGSCPGAMLATQLCDCAQVIGSCSFTQDLVTSTLRLAGDFFRESRCALTTTSDCASLGGLISQAPCPVVPLSHHGESSLDLVGGVARKGEARLNVRP